ncbi:MULTISPECIES: type VI secretion system lipoprotein TssJ [unclassified Bartonella]|uniref:type VI secretion system lipoprotein TssJ n=1 Tax=unclassified Bartonella TaxID=2645622 RepID=UPI0021C88FB4|nr:MULTISPECIES: type VI secretion system lipoprotein TssJ [unclassified Bartonella]UXN05039.1 type VI secretion system lipoprotein TssJ [Bartonella sp. HY406]UXN08091.1 type VI secretion system lipoprotein TssJ [Bartonella sp. HY761]
MRVKTVFSIISIGLLGVAASACTPSQSAEAMKKMGQIMADPSLPVGEQKSDKPSTALITVYADKKANTSEYGDAPIDVWVFQLSDPDEFEGADYYSLFEDPKKALETSYIRHVKKQVKPGESTVLTPFKFTDTTNFIAVVAAYANMDNVTWKAVEKVNATGEQYKIMVPIVHTGVAIQVHR